MTFDAGATGTLKLVDSFDFSGIVSGFNQDDHIDLLDMAFGAGTTASYVENQAGTGGILSVTDGAHTVNIALLGQYSADEPRGVPFVGCDFAQITKVEHLPTARRRPSVGKCGPPGTPGFGQTP